MFNLLIRGVAARKVARVRWAFLLIWAYFLVGEVAPFLHVSTHRPDHTHGPAPAASQHPDGTVEHTHHGFTHRHVTGTGAVTGDFAADSVASSEVATKSPVTVPVPVPDHESGSSLHFDLALIDEPSPQPLPAPGDSISAPPAAALVWTTRPAADGEPTRGPPLS
jgi:hypothetical protein